MGKKIRIICPGFEVEAEMMEEKQPKTCQAIWEALPFEANLEVWKEEVYFEIPVKVAPEDPTPKTTPGDVSYWPNGPAFCIFFGRSQPISPVSTFAKIASDVENFRKLKTGDRITVKRSK